MNGLNLSALSDIELIAHIEGRKLTELEQEFLERMRFDNGLSSKFGTAVYATRPPRRNR